LSDVFVALSCLSQKAYSQIIQYNSNIAYLAFLLLYSFHEEQRNLKIF